MNAQDDREPLRKPQISRFMLAMFDVLGFSRWLDSVGLQAVLDAYYLLIERVVVRPNEKGGLSAVQTREGSIIAVTGPPGYAYFSDTIILWHPLVPPFVDDFVTRCSSLICEALAMDIPLRGAITLGDAVLDRDSDFFLGAPVVEAARVEKAQNWLGLTFGQTAMWSHVFGSHSRYGDYRVSTSSEGTSEGIRVADSSRLAEALAGQAR